MMPLETKEKKNLSDLGLNAILGSFGCLFNFQVVRSVLLNIEDLCTVGLRHLRGKLDSKFLEFEVLQWEGGRGRSVGHSVC